MGRGLTYEVVKSRINIEGYRLISKKYIKSSEKLEIMCPRGCLFLMTYNSFQQGSRCPCYRVEKIKDKQKLNYNFVWDFFKSKGYTLLSDSYENARVPLKSICPKGHIINIRYESLKRGQGCNVCGSKRMADKNRTSIADIKKAFKDEGYTLTSKEYNSQKEYLEYICPNGHRNKIKYSKFKSGRRCPTCSGGKIGDLDSNRALIIINRTINKSQSRGIGHYIRTREDYKIWQGNCRKLFGDICIITGSRKIHYHHLNRPFYLIISEALSKIKLEEIINEKMLNKFIKLFFKLHNRCLGIPLSKEIHKEFHKLYGINGDLKNFVEFYHSKTGRNFTEDYPQVTIDFY